MTSLLEKAKLALTAHTEIVGYHTHTVSISGSHDDMTKLLRQLSDEVARLTPESILDGKSRLATPVVRVNETAVLGNVRGKAAAGAEVSVKQQTQHVKRVSDRHQAMALGENSRATISIARQTHEVTHAGASFSLSKQTGFVGRTLHNFAVRLGIDTPTTMRYGGRTLMDGRTHAAINTAPIVDAKRQGVIGKTAANARQQYGKVDIVGPRISGHDVLDEVARQISAPRHDQHHIHEEFRPSGQGLKAALGGSLISVRTYDSFGYDAPHAGAVAANPDLSVGEINAAQSSGPSVQTYINGVQQYDGNPTAQVSSGVTYSIGGHNVSQAAYESHRGK